MTYCTNCEKEGIKIGNLYAEVYFDGEMLCDFNYTLCFDCFKKYKKD